MIRNLRYATMMDAIVNGVKSGKLDGRRAAEMLVSLQASDKLDRPIEAWFEEAIEQGWMMPRQRAKHTASWARPVDQTPHDVAPVPAIQTTLFGLL